MYGNLIEAGNFFVLIISCYVGWRIFRWRQRSDIEKATSWIVCSWMFVFGGIGLNRGWFAISRFLHDDDSHWQSFMFEWRFMLVLATSALVGWGAVTFTSMIDEDEAAKKYGVFAAAAIAAFGLGFY